METGRRFDDSGLDGEDSEEWTYVCWRGSRTFDFIFLLLLAFFVGDMITKNHEVGKGESVSAKHSKRKATTGPNGGRGTWSRLQTDLREAKVLDLGVATLS